MLSPILEGGSLSPVGEGQTLSFAWATATWSSFSLVAQYRCRIVVRQQPEDLSYAVIAAQEVKENTNRQSGGGKDAVEGERKDKTREKEHLDAGLTSEKVFTSSKMVRRHAE